ncbi:MAG: tRNA-uridine aminocarboxypropyltransferase [Candidatus Binatia bacterium]|nr:tRNA-uridine aminocarboxypropyltransferase [Candidatus Binatia bacterium]
MVSNSKTLHGLTYQVKHRASCNACRRPREACYCSLVEPFDSRPRFVILTQPREAKHRFGTGRMAHLCVRNSLLIEGVDFSEEARVNRELHAPMTLPVLLYPGKDSIDLSAQPADERFTLAPGGKTLVVFVLDGTWKSVRKMIRLSRNVASLPTIRFMPPAASNYRIRRQPKPYYYSTVEAIHYVIEHFTPRSEGRSRSSLPHDNLLKVFNAVVARQLAYAPQG